MSDNLSITKRLRRNRRSLAIRELVQETHLHPSDFVLPLFLLEGTERKEPVESMPGIFRQSVDLAILEVKELYQMGIRAVDLFAVVPPNKKDRLGSEALNPDFFIYDAITAIKDACPEMCVMVDIALDPYTDHGHDGLVNAKGEILNDETVEILCEMSILSGRFGADMVAPSDMMDGRVQAIRRALDDSSLSNVGILSYAAKYASAFYGPFRDALGSSPKFGNKATYQMNPANRREALLECALDESEGADILMVKPALPYLDVLAKIRERTELPLAAYHVSGEYAMVMFAANNGVIDPDLVFYESLLSIKRAGADLIFSYAAPRVAKFLRKV